MRFTDRPLFIRWRVKCCGYTPARNLCSPRRCSACHCLLTAGAVRRCYPRNHLQRRVVMVPDMTVLSSVQFRRIAAASALVLTAGCQGPVSQDRTHEWVGTLPRRDTGFDRRTWQDTSAATVRRLIERLPDRIDSAAEHRLARNLLVSITDAPQGDD